MSTNVARIKRTSWARAMSAREILSDAGAARDARPSVAGGAVGAVASDDADTAGVATLVIETFLSGWR